MLKQLLKFKKKRSDIRFIPFEHFKVISKSEIGKTKSWMNAQDALKVSTVQPYTSSKQVTNIRQHSELQLSLPIEYEMSDKPIIVEETVHSPPCYDKKKFPFTLAKQEPKPAVSSVASKSLGIFSDTIIYSAMIKSELKQYDVTIKHFNHPNTFTSEKYSTFDDISAWIIFLSDDKTDGFLDKFIDRYVDKPTLFLFAKANRFETAQKINQFVAENNFAANQFEYEDYF